MSKFQIILISIFVVCIIGGIVAFATYKGNTTENELPAITVWGTFPAAIFDKYVIDLNTTREKALNISYVQIRAENFDKTFIETLARGQGPDAILIPQDLIYKHEDKIIPIPYTVISERDFRDTFIRQSELYLTGNGALALPFVVDPLVMYWNRDSFTNAGIAKPPIFWDEFDNLNTKLTQKDINSNVRKSAIALGEFNNISHAREIFGTLLMQAGNPITYRNTENFISSALKNGNYQGLNSSLAALDFFIQFSNPKSVNYSWNRSLSNSRSSFLSGNLATYFGFASEISDLRAKNPNIDFDVAPLPQARNGKNRATYGGMYGFSVVRSSANPSNTFSVVNSLLSSSALSNMIKLSYLPPVRLDMISTGSTDPYLSIFYDSALISKGWLDVSPAESNAILQKMIEAVTSGRKGATNAVEEASDELDILFQNI